MAASTAHSLADPSMLAKIDKLFACNVGHHIHLPQIVVVGDQSSGKSSVLEGLTRLPFPRDSGLCTRFATQITFRRAAVKSVSVSVIPGQDASQEHIDAVHAWKKNDLEQLSKEAFAGIMREVQALMGITGCDGGASKTFSSDVLSIEVAGPEEEHFSVIDVPGIFQRVTKDVTTKEDKDFVKAMVGEYMKNPRSIMLTVIPANVDVATQIILEMAEEADKEGQRTLGVLTKPDLVDKGAEQSVVDMVEGRSHQLYLGWCVVKNPGQKDMADPKFDRHTVEEGFFRTLAPWSGLPKDRIGVTALRARLQEVLAKHIRQEFPKVRAEVNKKLKDCKKALEGLGPKRDMPEEQQRFLISMATHFQAMTNKALDAKYVDDCFTEHPELKIATLVVGRNEELSRDFEKFGHTYHFKEILDKEEVGEDANGVPTPPPETGEQSGDMRDTTPPAACLYTRKFDDAEDVDILQPNEEILEPKRDGILDWITQVYDRSRGFELGQFDPSLLATTMKAQSKNWDDLATGYISDLVVLTHNFFNTLLKHVCTEDSIRQNIKTAIMEGLMERYRKGFDHVNFILQVERFGIPATQNHYFNENLQKYRQDRDRKDAEAKSFVHPDHIDRLVRLNDITQARSMSNKEHTIQDLHDILKSYYNVARKRIVDTLCMQAAAYHLISGPDTPLVLFSPTWVGGLEKERLEEIAGEDILVRRRRAQLMKEMEDLEKGRRILS